MVFSLAGFPPFPRSTIPVASRVVPYSLFPSPNARVKGTNTILNGFLRNIVRVWQVAVHLVLLVGDYSAFIVLRAAIVPSSLV